jgi:acetyl-CoA carboxylase beta subunit
MRFRNPQTDISIAMHADALVNGPKAHRGARGPEVIHLKYESSAMKS